MNNDTVGTNEFRLHYKLSYQKPSFLQRTMRSLHRNCSFGGVLFGRCPNKRHPDGPWTFPDIPVAGAWQGPRGTRGVAGKRAVPSVTPCQHLLELCWSRSPQLRWFLTRCSLNVSPPCLICLCYLVAKLSCILIE